MAKDNTTLYLLIGAAALGYMAYKKGLFIKPAAVTAPAALPGQTQGGLQSSQSVAVELPDLSEFNLTAPAQIDPTGEQITFF